MIIKAAARLAFCIGALALIVLVTAHPGEVHEELSAGELARRAEESLERREQATKCARQFAEFHAERKAKRAAAMGKRATPVDTAIAPKYSTIQNFTCITAPETTEGPYYVRNEIYRQDLRETQTGVRLVLDIGVLDTTTCTPAPNVLAEIWAATALGVYGGVGTERGKSYLRGGYTTNANGVAELTTIYPGFYTGRTIHIHSMFHQSWTTASNGTINSGSGYVRHIGQFFFEETLNNQVLATSPYTNNHQSRTLNSADGILRGANGNGYSAFVDTELIGSTLADGLLGYITVGINSRASYPISSTTYYPRKRELGLGSYHGDL